MSTVNSAPSSSARSAASAIVKRFDANGNGHLDRQDMGEDQWSGVVKALTNRTSARGVAKSISVDHVANRLASRSPEDLGILTRLAKSGAPLQAKLLYGVGIALGVMTLGSLLAPLAPGMAQVSGVFPLVFCAAVIFSVAMAKVLDQAESMDKRQRNEDDAALKRRLKL